MGGHHHHHHHKGSSNILFAFVLNLVFSLIEIVGAYFTNSVAIFSDAIHDLGDSLALLFAYFSEKFSHKSPDSKFTYGYRRFSVLSALINAIILLFGSVYVLYEAIDRLQSPQVVEPKGMLALAFLGVIVNGIAAYKLSKDEGMNQRMVMLHMLEDLLGWAAVLVVSMVLLFKPWYFLDSVLSILISIVILRGVYFNLKKSFSIFMQKFPEDLNMEKLMIKLKGVEQVLDVHAVKGWSIDDTHFYLSLHVQVEEETTIKEIDKLRKRLKQILEDFHVFHCSIEFEAKCIISD